MQNCGEVAGTSLSAGAGSNEPARCNPGPSGLAGLAAGWKMPCSEAKKPRDAPPWPPWSSPPAATRWRRRGRAGPGGVGRFRRWGATGALSVCGLRSTPPSCWPALMPAYCSRRPMWIVSFIVTEDSTCRIWLLARLLRRKGKWRNENFWSWPGPVQAVADRCRFSRQVMYWLAASNLEEMSSL